MRREVICGAACGVNDRHNRNLVFVRHALPCIDPSLPARAWRLSEEGRQRSRILAGRLSKFQPAAVYSSVEPKAVETAEIVAAECRQPVVIVPDLHEHDRRNVGFLDDQAFEAAIRRLFRSPDERVVGG